MRILRFALLLLFASVWNTFGQGIDPILKAQIDDLVEKTFLPLNHVPALALSIVGNSGATLYHNAYGYEDIERSIPAGNTSLFGIGSISKSFTAVVVVRTLNQIFPEHGESALDIPVSTMYPANKSFLLGDRYRSEEVTFRDLLSHRICTMSDSIGIWAAPYSSPSERAYRQRYAAEVCSFRTQFVYNDAMLILAGEAIGIIANKTFEALLEELFSDLGMKDTTYVKRSDDFENKPNFAKPYYYRAEQLRRYNASLLNKVWIAPPSGGILSSAQDMSRYLDFHLNYGKLNGDQIVSEEVMKWIHNVAIQMPFEDVRVDPDDAITVDVGYGLGMFLGIRDGRPYSGHGGYVAPYLSQMSLFREPLKLGIFSVSSGPGLMNPLTDHLNLLHHQIYKILTGSPIKTSDPTHKYIKNPFKVSEFKYPQSRKRKQNFNLTDVAIGRFGNGQYGELELFNRNSKSDPLEVNFYIQYGLWASGFLKTTDEAGLYVWELDSELIHEMYAEGEHVHHTILVDLRTQSFVLLDFGWGKFEFEYGVSLDTLPVIPYLPDSCGTSLWR